MQNVVLLVLLFAAVGIAMGVAITNVRLRRENAAWDRAALALREWRDREFDKRIATEELVRLMGPAYLHAQRSWGFRVPDEIRALIGYPSSEEVSKALVEGGPGIGLLSDGQRTTTRFATLPEFTGWRPPRLVAARRNGEERP